MLLAAAVAGDPKAQAVAHEIETALHARRAQRAANRDDAKAEFLAQVLSPICEQLGDAGANHMGHLTRAQAALFHNATQMLADLEEQLTEELAEESDDAAG